MFVLCCTCFLADAQHDNQHQPRRAAVATTSTKSPDQDSLGHDSGVSGATTSDSSSAFVAVAAPSTAQQDQLLVLHHHGHHHGQATAPVVNGLGSSASSASTSSFSSGVSSRTRNGNRQGDEKDSCVV